MPISHIPNTEQIRGQSGELEFCKAGSGITPLHNGTKTAKSAHLVAENLTLAVLLSNICMIFQEPEYDRSLIRKEAFI